ncbi:MAG: hypothetical protein ACLP0B_21495 [Steroidobacteraceae bacterium]|jgi:hypothetical protein
MSADVKADYREKMTSILVRALRPFIVNGREVPIGELVDVADNDAIRQLIAGGYAEIAE